MIVFKLNLIKQIFSISVLYRFMGASSSSNKMPTFTVEPLTQHTASVIFLHGLGDTGEGWCQMFREIKKPHIRYVFPTAPVQPVTLNAGMPMPSWFDIFGLSPNSPEDGPGINLSVETLNKIIDEEIKRGIKRNRIVIGGFSQGGAVALYSAFSGGSKLGGILALSTWMPLHSTFQGLVEKSENTDTPILQCHGDIDPIVNYQLGQRTSELLKGKCSHHEFKTYKNLQHSSCPEEISDVSNFLDRVIP